MGTPSTGSAPLAHRADDAIEPTSNGPLNGAPPRQLLVLHLQDMIASADRVAVLSVSLNRIDDVIHALGYSIADQVLVQVAVLLALEVDERGTITRMGDDRYVIILPGAAANDAATRAAGIVNALSKPLAIGEYHLHVPGCVGIAVSSADAQDAASLLAGADAALHEARTHGGKGYQFFSVQMKQTALKRLTLESELRRAIEHGELELHYQPKVCLRTRTICGVEALVRWRTATRGLLFPDAFIPIAEQSGLIVPLGEWVVDAACRLASASWYESQGSSVAVSVNMSAAELRVPRPADMLEAALRRHGLPPRLLEIELTESALMADIHRATASLLEIAELGVRLALDDFGTGYSNLSQLGRLPISILKIDRSLVAGIAISSRDAVIIRTVIEMAHALGMKIVAEGVETSSQLAVLREEGCDEVQGYLIAKPMDAVAFAAWSRSWNYSAIAEQAEISVS